MSPGRPSGLERVWQAGLAAADADDTGLAPPIRVPEEIPVGNTPAAPLVFAVKAGI